MNKKTSSIKRDTGFNAVRRLARLARETAYAHEVSLAKSVRQELIRLSYQAEECIRRHSEKGGVA